MCRRPTRDLLEVLLRDTRPLAPPRRTIIVQPCVHELRNERGPTWQDKARSQGWIVTQIDSTPRAFREVGLHPLGHEICLYAKIDHPMFAVEVPAGKMGRALRFFDEMGKAIDGRRILGRTRAQHLKATGVLPTTDYVVVGETQALAA